MSPLHSFETEANAHYKQYLRLVNLQHFLTRGESHTVLSAEPCAERISLECSTLVLPEQQRIQEVRAAVLRSQGARSYIERLLYIIRAYKKEIAMRQFAGEAVEEDEAVMQRFGADLEQLRRYSQRGMKELRTLQINSTCLCLLQAQHEASCVELYSELKQHDKVIRHIRKCMNLMEEHGSLAFFFHVSSFPSILHAAQAWPDLLRLSVLTRQYAGLDSFHELYNTSVGLLPPAQG